MEIDNEKWTRVVAKLIVDTRKRTIKWKSFNPPETPTMELGLASYTTRSTKIYLAEFNEQAFRFEVYRANGLSIGKAAAPTYKLSISKRDGTVLRVIPVTSGLFDLAQAIDDQLSQVDEFVTRYLDH